MMEAFHNCVRSELATGLLESRFSSSILYVFVVSSIHRVTIMPFFPYLISAYAKRNCLGLLPRQEIVTPFTPVTFNVTAPYSSPLSLSSPSTSSKTTPDTSWFVSLPFNGSGDVPSVPPFNSTVQPVEARYYLVFSFQLLMEITFMWVVSHTQF